MKPRLSTPLFGRAGQAYGALVLSTSALQIPLCLAEQVAFLTDVIDACRRIETSFSGPALIRQF